MDRIFSHLLLGFILTLLSAYLVRVVAQGRARFERVDRQGGSAVLGKSAMEMLYWGIQPAARFLLWAGVTPNAVTWGNFFLTLLAAGFVANGYLGIGAFIATFSSILDALDGLLARMSGTTSDAGAVLDATVDRYSEFFLIGALVLLYRDTPWLLVLALVALAGSFMVSYTTAKGKELRIEVPQGSMRRPERTVLIILGIFLSSFPVQGLQEGYPIWAALALIAVLANKSVWDRSMAMARVAREREAQGQGKRQ